MLDQIDQSLDKPNLLKQKEMGNSSITTKGIEAVIKGLAQ